MNHLHHGDELQENDLSTETPKDVGNKEAIIIDDSKEQKRSFRRGVCTGALAMVAVLLVLSIGTVVLLNVRGGGASVLTSNVKTKVQYLAAMIDYYYYEDVDDEALVEGLYKGITEGLDPYSTYYTAEEYQEMKLDVAGNYAGIGALLSQSIDTKQVYIVKVYEDSPAEKVGLQAGDEIVSADEYNAIDYDLDDFVKHVRGDEGSEVTLAIRHADATETVDYQVVRAQVAVPSVSYQMLSGEVGYINITEFTGNTQGEFESALADLESQGMKSVIFDVRTNGGGLVDSVLAILDDILPEGRTLYMEDKRGKRTEYTSDEEHCIDYPIVVLTSQHTASAAEIFAGAIRDFEYGTLLGVTTYGKGIVQTTIPLTDGSALKLTTATYYTPSGECIHEKGIEPDVVLEYEFLGGEEDEYSLELDNQVQKAIEILQ